MPRIPIDINKATITSSIAEVEDSPFLSSHTSDGRQMMAIKIDRNKGFKIGAANFMPAIIIQIAANEIRMEGCLPGISYIFKMWLESCMYICYEVYFG